MENLISLGLEARDEEYFSQYAGTPRERVSALLIDDDADDASIIAKLASRSRQFDIDLKICLSVDEARRFATQRDFDVIFVDFWLGLQTSIGFISDFLKTRDALFILLTGLDEPDIRRVAFRAGVKGFLSKEDLSTQAIEAVTLAVLAGRRRC